MKRNVRRFGFTVALALGLVILAVPRSAAAYQQDDDSRRQAQDQNRRNDDQGARANQQMDQDRSYGIQRENGQGNMAEQYGYQDGVTQGMHDRQSGRRARPTDDANYKHGLRGYDSSFGDRNQYRQKYRQAYEQGYNRGYNGNGYNQQDQSNDRDRRTDRPRGDDHNRDNDDHH
jgi:hypothetical protein